MKAFNLVNQLINKTASTTQKNSEEPSELSEREGKILVVDDELNQRLMKRILSRELGLEIASFSNGIEGLEYAKKTPAGAHCSGSYAPWHEWI
jgi:PleD family two-component response regulator